MSILTLDIVTSGWELPVWERTFYPEDLPRDWRLTYFANEFPAVMVPSEHWAKAGTSLLHAWAEDVQDGFRFYLADPGPWATRIDLDRARNALGTKLAGLVLDEGGAQGPRGEQITRFQILGELGAVIAADCLPARQIPPALIGDLRAARAWLETLAIQLSCDRGLLVLDGGDSDVEDLRRWWNLAWLMGRV